MKKNALKGATLVEIIVSLAIFGMLGLVLVQLGTNVDKTTKSSNRLNKRVAIQAPYAASQDVAYVAAKLDDDGKIVKDEDGNVVTVDAKLVPDLTNIEVYIDEDNDNTPDVVSVKKKDSTEREDVDSDAKIFGHHYNTKPVVDNNIEVYNPDDPSNTNHHLQFISIIDVIQVEKDFALGDLPWQITYSDKNDLDDEGNPRVKVLSNAVWQGNEDADSVATISDTGLITPQGTGSCIYTGVADGGLRYTVTITVSDT